MRRILALLNRRSVCSRRRKIAGAVDRVVGAHALEGAAAVVQRVRQDVDLGVAPVDELAVHPDLAVAVVHRHGISSGCGETVDSINAASDDDASRRARGSPAVGTGRCASPASPHGNDPRRRSLPKARASAARRFGAESASDVLRAVAAGDLVFRAGHHRGRVARQEDRDRARCLRAAASRPASAPSACARPTPAAASDARAALVAGLVVALGQALLVARQRRVDEPGDQRS